jgi:hypothetical protein
VSRFARLRPEHPKPKFIARPPAAESRRRLLRAVEHRAQDRASHKSRLFGNRWLPQKTRVWCNAPEVQAIFRRRRHQPRRPPLAKIGHVSVCLARRN